eukprot:247898-Pleurochrysis_carterae.AAC.2
MGLECMRQICVVARAPCEAHQLQSVRAQTPFTRSQEFRRPDLARRQPCILEQLEVVADLGAQACPSAPDPIRIRVGTRV